MNKMKFRGYAIPNPSSGYHPLAKKSVVPNQSMSLEEILERFTRGEPVAVGKEGAVYDDTGDDLEKVPHLDLVDREEFVDRQKAIQERFKKQEAKKAAAAQKAAHDEAVRLEQAKITAAKAISGSGSEPPAK